MNQTQCNMYNTYFIHLHIFSFTKTCITRQIYRCIIESMMCMVYQRLFKVAYVDKTLCQSCMNDVYAV